MEKTLEYAGIKNYTGKAHYNLCPAKLVEYALKRKEGLLTDQGALVVKTGKYTGRSPHDKFIVDTPEVHEQIAWGDVNVAMSVEHYNALKEKVLEYMSDKELFVFKGFAGADKKYRRKFTVINELACQNLFIHQLLIRPTKEELDNFGLTDYTILVAPGFHCVSEVDHTNSEAAIIINFTEHTVIIVGSQYSGEIKKSVFTIMNYCMPLQENILPMHCSANMDPDTGETAIFFGLSGTGKTTLSTDPNRMLIGDDEHGWSEEGIFNFEGGCYAKTINLSPTGEPDIYRAIRFGSELENVVVDAKTRQPDYDDGTLTENTRVGYPIEYIQNAQIPGVGGVPKVVIFLTADAFGVLPPISRLDHDAAMYQFVTGFTSKVAGTERGISEPQPTFSTLFGEPFMPLEPSIYAQLLGSRLEDYGTKVYLVNTGWNGGPYGIGLRMKLSYTRAMVTAAVNGSLDNVIYYYDSRFNLHVPQSCPGVPEYVLNPKDTWANKEAYEDMANELAMMFEANFNTKYPHMPENIRKAGPHPKK